MVDIKKKINAQEPKIQQEDNYGICASSGSACSSKEKNPSHVLMAIGLKEELIKGALRVTLGDFNTKEEVDYLVEKLEKAVKKLRKI